MGKFRSIIKWFALGGAVVLLCAVLGVALYTRTENFQRWVREEAVSAVNSSIRGALTIDRLEGSVWRHLTLYGVALRYEDDEIVRIPQARYFLFVDSVTLERSPNIRDRRGAAAAFT